MKYLLVFAALLLSRPLFAQACQVVNVATDAQKKALLEAYIQDCHQRNFFFEDKGAVKLVVYQEADGRTCWLLSAIIDDRYRSQPPAQYAELGNDIMLVYRGDSLANILPIAGDAAARAACIAEVLGSRVYPYIDKPEYTTVIDAQGNPQQVQVKHMLMGNFHNDLIIKFNKDGTVSKFTPV